MILVGDCIESMRGLPAESVQTCVTSPPYFGLRDYGHDGQIGLEPTPEAFVAKLVEVFREVRRVLRDDGTLWLNLGDSYSTESKWGGSTGGKAAAGLHGADGGGRAKARHGIPDKNLLGIPWRVAFALQADGWYLRQDIIWSKPNPMPESVRDRCTKAHEYLFLLSKGPRYHFDADAIAEPLAASSIERLSQPNIESQAGSDRVPGKTNGAMKAVVATGRMRNDEAKYNENGGRGFLSDSTTRNKRSVWTVPTMPFREAHFATFPEALIQPCILAGAPAGATVLDPFMGAGTTAVVCERLGRQWIGCELNPEYAAIAEARIRNTQPGLPLEAA
ncbi:DNA-methyltransferase [Novilysobacter erysipheiresistens]|uniref:Methyltransferase n=1 Tax=Novilysobacter erysipheiresistens TaxID=1749332 RepID=A0ABU7YUR1_9GAMM